MQACDEALESVTTYDHSRTATWNNTIIVRPSSRNPANILLPELTTDNICQNTILQKLIAESSHPPSNTPSYKFAINSTIIQHHTATTSTATSTGAEGSAGSSGSPPAERRGMHSATGAYWNNERDGMWNYKYERGLEKGMEVVISVIWIGI